MSVRLLWKDFDAYNILSLALEQGGDSAIDRQTDRLTNRPTNQPRDGHEG